MRFYRTPRILPLLYPSLVWRLPADEKKVYLTFDDGPVPGPTEFVLDTLKAFGITGTFFCIGDNVRRHPELFRRISQEGHTIGNHTFNHLNGWKTQTQYYADNAAMFDEVASQVLPDFKPAIFRPPYGKITRAQLKKLDHYKIVMWDVLSYDFDMRISPGDCLFHTVMAVRNGSIVVLHDSHKAWPRMHYVLPRLVETLLSRGFHCKALNL